MWFGTSGCANGVHENALCFIMQTLVQSTTDHCISWEYDNELHLLKQTDLFDCIKHNKNTHRQFSAALRDFCHSYHIDYDDPKEKKKKKKKQ